MLKKLSENELMAHFVLVEDDLLIEFVRSCHSYGNRA